jgi:hypothetical protein
MGVEAITDAKIDRLLTTDKRVANPQARETDKGSHLQTNYRVVSPDGYEFNLYVRQNKRIPEDFSCGLLWNMPSGESLTLIRYNGSSHFHLNRIEGNEVDYKCHVHEATERYISAGLKPEGFARECNRYQSLGGALHCLVGDCNISGLSTKPDHPDLFE